MIIFEGDYGFDRLLVQPACVALPFSFEQGPTICEKSVDALSYYIVVLFYCRNIDQGEK